MSPGRNVISWSSNSVRLIILWRTWCSGGCLFSDNTHIEFKTSWHETQQAWESKNKHGRQTCVLAANLYLHRRVTSFSLLCSDDGDISESPDNLQSLCHLLSIKNLSLLFERKESSDQWRNQNLRVQLPGHANSNKRRKSAFLVTGQ